MSANRLCIPIESANHYSIIEVSNILYLTAAGNITYLFTTNGVFNAGLPLHYFENILSREMFCRIHDTHLVALDRIISFDGTNMLMPGALLPIGKRYINSLRTSIRVLEEDRWWINNDGKLETGTGELQ